MKLEETEIKLRRMLLPVLGVDTLEEVLPHHSLVFDLGAESLDFVELMYLIEREFGVALKMNEIVLAGGMFSEEDLFLDDNLTLQGYEILKKHFPEHSEKIRQGMSKFALFSLVTVRDLAQIVHSKLMKEENRC